MSGKLKRPSSARRNIKQELFSPFVSLTRLRHIQNLLTDEDAGSPDALLCIAGIDARYNEGMQDLLNYLLFGFFEVRKKELEKSGFEEEVVEDVMFLIRKHSIDVYCNPINYMYFLPYMAHWRNLRIHCMRDEDYEDEEKAEEFKIVSFVRMTEGCRKIAVPFSSTTHQQKFDIMAMEKWPIVQAFALEEIGGGGFFTMKYEVEDYSDQLMAAYQSIDPVSLEGIVTEQLPLFERQWDSMLSITDADRSKSTKDIQGKYLLEPLKTFFQHGRINSGKGARRIQSERSPFVLLGSETRRENLENVTGRVVDQQTSESGGKAPKHMICQCVSPKSALCCRRTYFFSNGVLPHPVLSSAGESRNRLPEKSDIKLLQRVYSACIDGVLAAINIYSLTLDVKQAETEAKQTLWKSLEDSRMPINIDHIAPVKNIDFKLEAYNAQNRCVTGPATCLLLKFCSLSVYNLPSVESRGESCGSVSFGETFLNSVLHIQLSDDSRDIDGEYSVLSSVIPRMISWQRSSAERPVYRDIQRLLQTDDTEADLETLGRRLMWGDHVQYITEDNTAITIQEGDLYIYEHGLVYTHPHHGTVVLPSAEMTSLHIYDGNSPSVVALIVVGYQEHVAEYLPLHMRSPFNRFILVTEPKTKAYKLIFSEVLSVWKGAEQRPELQWLEDLPEELTELHTSLQNSFKLKTTPASRLTPVKKAKGRIEGLERLMPHFESSSVSEETVPRKYTELLAGRPWDEGSFGDNQQVVVSIIGGLPGSGKLELCECLRKLSSEDSKWTIIKPGGDSVEQFDKEAIVSHLRSTYLAYKTNRAAASKMRAILLTPGYTDTVDVIQAIVGQPDKDLAKHLKIGAVTVCVDPQNSYMCDRYAFPKLLDQCAQGWVNNIVFTTSSDTQDSELSSLQNTVRAVNGDVALLLAERGEVSRAPDLDRILSDSAFHAEELIKARCRSCPGWWKGAYNSGPSYPNIEQLVLRFSQPLERNRLNTRLKDLKTNLKKHPFHGNVYYVKGKVMFAESQQLHEFHYSVLSGSVSVTTVQPVSSSQLMNGEPHAPYAVVFMGIGLSEGRLRDWLRDSAKQKPQKRIHRTRKNLNRVEINRIHKEHHLDGLPEGWFYNGAKYVSLTGEKSDHHPNLDQFLEEYLTKVNKEVDQYNAAIDSQSFHDLFE